jgi:hypothetical protein
MILGKWNSILRSSRVVNERTIAKPRADRRFYRQICWDRGWIIAIPDITSGSCPRYHNAQWQRAGSALRSSQVNASTPTLEVVAASSHLKLVFSVTGGSGRCVLSGS